MTRAKTLGRRVFFYLVTAWIAITINFFLPRVMPGNAVQSVLGRLEGSGPVTPRAIAAMTAAFGLNTKESLAGQYFDYLGNLFHGNLGISINYFPSSVASIIASSLPWTLVLVGLSTIFAFVLGTGLGVVAGWRRGSILDGLVPLTTFLSAMPYFWVGLILIAVLAIKWPILPFEGGSASTVTPGLNGAFIGSALQHAVLPALTIVVSAIGGWLLGMRNMVVSVLSNDYIVLAEAKGLSRRRIIGSYVTRNAILPNVAGFALALGFVVAGSIVTEVTFGYPGIGDVLYIAVTSRDYPLMQGIFLIITLVVLVACLLADIVYVVLDPRTSEA
jgi:peptide/nickel transport system permease protein